MHRLLRLDSSLSAASPLVRWQKWTLAVLAAALPAGYAIAPYWVRDAGIAILSVPFFLVMLIRLAALSQALRPRAPSAVPQLPHAKASALPFYSVLVALYRETEAVPALTEALARLDYPSGRIEILFITEADDEGTRAALLNHGLSDAMRIITVPQGSPRTKPRALNYALGLARGELVTVFDAEDIPEPGQLREAAAEFAAGGVDLAAVQARLNIYNPGTNPITRQFTLEYSTLFDFLLPVFERLGVPIPLGGTSNHFRRALLEKAGAWDAFNVTEDADLGFRLARLGLKTALISSTTWEEAPQSMTAWVGQRTRWLKGWMQTYLVHTRSPRRLWRELGARRFLGFQMLMGGMLLSALAHPVCLAGLASSAMVTDAASAVSSGPLAIACWYNLIVCYTSAMALAALAARSRGHRKLAVHAIFLPVYWLAISWAAYRAIWELNRRPFHWTKTRHHGFTAPGAHQIVGMPFSQAALAPSPVMSPRDLPGPPPGAASEISENA